MAHPGLRKPEDYGQLPPLVHWNPVEERKWAMKYVHEDGSEDYEEFKMEFERRYPEIFKGSYVSYMPSSVDKYLRHNSRGVPQDIDWELAQVPLSDEEIEDADKKRVADQRKRRKAAIAAAEERNQPRLPIVDKDEDDSNDIAELLDSQ